MPRLRVVATPLTLVATSILAALLLCEGVVRAVRPQLLYRYPVGLYVADPARGYRLAPGFAGEFDTPEYRTSVRINEAGLRENRDYGPKPRDVFRVLFIGDSFTMGHSVEEAETFVRVFEKLARRPSETAPRVEAINAGVPGYNTAQALAFLVHDGLRLEPDLVVLGFFVGNDVRDNALPADRLQVRDGVLVTPDPPSGLLPVPVRRSLAMTSHLYHFLWPYQRALRSREGRAPEARERLAVFLDPDHPEVRAGWEATDRELERFARTMRALKTPAAVVVIPDPAQVDPPAASAHLSAGRATARLDAASRDVVALAQAHGLPALDLLPVFRDATAAPLYYPQDGHLTVVGNRLAARLMLDFLLDEGLVPAGSPRSRHAVG